MRERRAKILATLGPASRSREGIRKLLEAGADGIRLNMSHGTPAEHREAAGLVRGVAGETGRPVGLLVDLAGPKIRTGEIRGGGPVPLESGARVWISETPVEGDASGFSSTRGGWIEHVPQGGRILVDDGAIELRVVGREPGRLVCRVEIGGDLRPRKGINLPGIQLPLPSLTPKDEEDLRLGLEIEADLFALSFVRSARDLRAARERIAACGGDTPVLAKIEKAEAIDRLDEIVGASDGVLVARGDLGVETAPERVPVLQKRIIAAANAAGKMVITATQMLQSMLMEFHPTRAEASDVANAVLDGSDALLLTGETAVGAHPALTVSTMDRIVRAVEASSLAGTRLAEESAGSAGSVSRALAEAAAFAAREMRASRIVVFTQTGVMAGEMAALRPRQGIAALTPREPVRRRLAFLWGVEPHRLAFEGGSEGLIRRCDRLLVREGLASPGEEVVMMAGRIEGLGISRAIKIHRVEDPAQASG